MSTRRCTSLWRLARDAAEAPRWWPSAATAAASCSPTPTSTSWCCCPTAALDHALPAGAIESFITACWDIGLEIGSSVRTRRRVRGRGAARRDGADRDARIAPRLRLAPAVRGLPRRRPTRRWTPRAFLRAKTLEMQQRHVKYESTPYALEPNCKESPGGLRDLQVLVWVARAAGLGRTWAEMAAKGLITPFEVSQLQQARRHAEADPRAPARRRRAARGPAGLRPADRRGRELRLPRPRGAPARLRGADAPLLLGRQGGDPAQPDPDAEHRGAHHRLRATRRCARSTRASSTAAACSRSPRRLCMPRTRTRSSRPSWSMQQTAGHQRAVGAHAARAVQRARADGRALPPRPGQPRAVHGHPAPAAGA